MDPIQRFVSDSHRYTSREALHSPPRTFTLSLTDGTTRTIVRAPRTADPTAVVRALKIALGGPAFAIMGGAGQMTAESMADARRILEDGLCAFAADHHAVIVDGGTNVGAMRMLGDARARHNYSFPLIGVAPERKVQLPGESNPVSEAELDVDHSHFVLVEGDDWGDESDLLAGIAAAAGALAGRQPAALGVIINGGAIVAAEAHARAVGPLRFPLLVLEGSGRFADELAAARRAGRSDDPHIRAILDQGEITVLSVSSDPGALRDWLETFFS